MNGGLAFGLSSQTVTLLSFALIVVIAVVTLQALYAYVRYQRRLETLPAEGRRDHLTQEIAKLELDLNALKDERKTLQEELDGEDGLRAGRAEAKAGLDLLREEHDRLKTQLDGMAAKQEQIAETQAKLDAVKTDLEQARHAAANAEAQLQSAQRTLDELERQKQQLEDQTRELEQSRDQARERAQTAKEEEGDAQRQRDAARHEANQAEKERDAQAREVAELKAQHEDLRAEVEALKSLKETLEGWAEQLKETPETTSALADLKTPPGVLTVSRFKQEQNKLDEANALDRFESYLQEVGLQFSQRRVYAFHTALKTASISPLTVLAGISGTGKSELPRRYAEGMGLHFLQMAVQPSWDSPQDLFGFYNYLEKRYAATDLSRALVHLDHRNHPEQAKPYHNRMLLVLLDEMNLARVEYYFSEFLSRLEVRRSVNPDDAASRQQAEVTLDLGGGKERIDQRVFVGGNVLFVGTMNEDESTQSLSDKVNDRSNVLRFGRPKGMGNQTLNNQAKGATGFLSHANWQTWHQTPDRLATENQQKLREWIDRLNTALSELGRPFGHRVSQAIESYVSNYPGDDPAKRLKNAFADQIEQRVLPKLRGMDTDPPNDEPMKAIEALAQETGDDELAVSIREAIEGDAIFQWRGVERDA